jgi:hypothetical protein
MILPLFGWIDSVSLFDVIVHFPAILYSAGYELYQKVIYKWIDIVNYFSKKADISVTPSSSNSSTQISEEKWNEIRHRHDRHRKIVDWAGPEDWRSKIKFTYIPDDEEDTNYIKTVAYFILTCAVVAGGVYYYYNASEINSAIYNYFFSSRPPKDGGGTDGTTGSTSLPSTEPKLDKSIKGKITDYKTYRTVDLFDEVTPKGEGSVTTPELPSTSTVAPSSGIESKGVIDFLDKDTFNKFKLWDKLREGYTQGGKEAAELYLQKLKDESLSKIDLYNKGEVLGIEATKAVQNFITATEDITKNMPDTINTPNSKINYFFNTHIEEWLEDRKE